jgi:hypothetical protein
MDLSDVRGQSRNLGLAAPANCMSIFARNLAMDALDVESVVITSPRPIYPRAAGILDGVTA